MFEQLSQFSPGQMIGLAGVVAGPLIAIVAIISAVWARVRCTELKAHRAEAELALKQQMLERGMSADEIERVLAAGQGSAKNHSMVGAEDNA